MAFELTRVDKDPNLKACLAKRRMDASLTEKARDLLVVPVKDDHGHLAGSLEVYLESDAAEGGRAQLQDDDKYWLEVFQGYAASIGAGMK